MKTKTPTTKKARAASKSAHVNHAGGVAVRPFVVPTKWVEITANIEHDLVAKFHTARDAKRNRLRLPTGLISNIVSLYERTGNKDTGWHDWQFEALGRSMTGGRGKKLVPVSINFREDEWERIIECSKAMEVEPVAMLRVLFSRMVREI